MELSGPSPLELARLQKGLSIRDLAEELGTNRGTLSKIERGVVRTSPDFAIKISEFFDEKVTRDEILFPEKHAKPLTKKPAQRVPGRKPVRRAELQEA